MFSYRSTWSAVPMSPLSGNRTRNLTISHLAQHSGNKPELHSWLWTTPKKLWVYDYDYSVSNNNTNRCYWSSLFQSIPAHRNICSQCQGQNRWHH